MKRRDFLARAGSAALAVPRLAQAQQTGLPVIGFINPTSPAAYPHVIAAFHKGLQEAGYVEGKNVVIEYRWAEGRLDRLPALAVELARRRVHVIVATGGDSSAFAAKAATTTIPIVFNSAGDPVRTGLVDGLSRPGGNMTGVSRVSSELLPKRLELLAEVAPKAEVIGFLTNPTNRTVEPRIKDVQMAAQSLGRKVHVLKATTVSEIDWAFTSLKQIKIDALLILNDSFFNSSNRLLGALSVRHAVPAIYQERNFALAGGLMSYGASLAAAYHVMGVYAGRVLEGAKPADLPVQQQDKVEFIVNLNTARALGLTIPLPLLGRADELIE
jgi:putative ABC transport system substrate-binding protein